MLQFASPAWVAALDERLRRLPPPEHAGGTEPLRVRYRFLAEGGATVSYDLVLGAEQVRAEVSPAGVEATVTLTQSHDTARAVAAGRLGAQQALLDGSIEVSGTVTALLEWRPALDALDPVYAELRAETA